MAELNLLHEVESRNPYTDWVLRGGVALFFLLFGLEKFPSDAGSHWVMLFQQIGLGQWFRYFTGVVEVLGAVLVLIPRVAIIGFLLLGCAMLGAVLIWIFVLKQPENVPIPGFFLIAVVLVCWKLRR